MQKFAIWLDYYGSINIIILELNVFDLEMTTLKDFHLALLTGMHMNSWHNFHIFPYTIYETDFILVYTNYNISFVAPDDED